MLGKMALTGQSSVKDKICNSGRFKSYNLNSRKTSILKDKTEE